MYYLYISRNISHFFLQFPFIFKLFFLYIVHTYLCGEYTNKCNNFYPEHREGEGSTTTLFETDTNLFMYMTVEDIGKACASSYRLCAKCVYSVVNTNTHTDPTCEKKNYP